MEKEEVLSNLCCYDKRNPDCSLDDEEIKEREEKLAKEAIRRKRDERCFCDNCFYGRTELAEYILKLLGGE
jgi:hypothetical protein